MKIIKKPAAGFCAVITALLSGCQISVAPVAVTPAPVVEAEPVVVNVPPAYVWDGVEYVGDYNGQFMYFSAGGVWVVCDPVVLGRFHGWERYHSDWRAHAIRNEREHRLGGERRNVVERKEVERKSAEPARKAVAPANKPAVLTDKRVEPARKQVAPANKPAVSANKTVAPVKKKDDKKDNK
jgi:hypothetical protein